MSEGQDHEAGPLPDYWCESCNRGIGEDDLEDGACPACGAILQRRRRIPWTLKTMVLATVVYLGWRAYQGIEWLIHHA